MLGGIFLYPWSLQRLGLAFRKKGLQMADGLAIDRISRRVCGASPGRGLASPGMPIPSKCGTQLVSFYNAYTIRFFWHAGTTDSRQNHSYFFCRPVICCSMRTQYHSFDYVKELALREGFQPNQTKSLKPLRDSMRHTDLLRNPHIS